MRLLLFTFIISVFKTLNLSGDVTFSFIYADQPGTGFHKRPEAQTSLKEVGQLIGSHWLKHHDAHIVVKVVSQEDLIDNKNHFLANIKPFDIKNKNDINLNYHHTYLAKKIILEENYNTKFDMHLNINFNNNYNFNNTAISYNEYDFKTILIHEFTHALGFLSLFLSKKLEGKFACPKHPKAILEEKIEHFIQKLFQFGMNDIEGKCQNIDANNLQKELNFYESLNVDIDRIIEERVDSSSEIFIHESFLNKMLKDELQTQTSSENRFKLYQQFINITNKNQISMDEFIQYKTEDINILFEVFEFGVKKLMNFKIEKKEEIRLKKYHFFYTKLRGNWHDRLGIEEDNEDPDLSMLFEVLIFCENYFNGEIIKGEEKSRILNLIKNQAEFYGMSTEEYAEFFNFNNSAIEYTYFDQFVVNKSGEKFFNQDIDSHLIEYCFPKKGTQNKQIPKQLYFKGPNTIKYIGFPIPLNGLDVSHISKKKNP